MTTGEGEFRHRLRSLRRSRKLTQTGLALKIGYGFACTVSDWERGKTTPNLYTIKALCRFFNVSADYLLGLSDEKGR